MPGLGSAAVPGEGGESENSQHDSAGVEATQAAVLACHTRPEATQPARRVHFDAQPPQIKPPTPVPAGPEAAAPEPEDGAEAGKDGAESGRATGKRRRLDDTSQGEEGLAQLLDLRVKAVHVAVEDEACRRRHKRGTATSRRARPRWRSRPGRHFFNVNL